MSDGKRVFYLRDRGDGAISFRIKVPVHLRPAFDRNEIQMNLPAGVSDKRKLASELGECCKEIFDRMQGVKDMVDAFNPGKVRRVLKEYMKDTIKEWREGPPLDNDDKWFCEQEAVETHIGNLREGIGTRQFLKYAGHKAQRLFGKRDPQLAREIMIAELEAYEQIREELLADVSDSTFHDRGGEPDPTLMPPMARPSEHRSEIGSTGVDPTNESIESEDGIPGGTTLEEALAQFEDHKLTTGKWTKNTVKDMGARVKAMKLYFGESTPVDSITLDQGKDYVKRLQAMRVGFVARKGARAFIRGEQEDPSDRPILDSTSVREYLMLARSVFTFCEACGWITGKHPPACHADSCQKEGSQTQQEGIHPRGGGKDPEEQGACRVGRYAR